MLEGNICIDLIDLKEFDFDVSIEKLRMIVKLTAGFFMYNKSSNIDEVIRSVYFSLTIRFHRYKKA